MKEKQLRGLVVWFVWKHHYIEACYLRPLRFHACKEHEDQEQTALLITPTVEHGTSVLESFVNSFV